MKVAKFWKASLAIRSFEKNAPFNDNKGVIRNISEEETDENEINGNNAAFYGFHSLCLPGMCVQKKGFSGWVGAEPAQAERL